MNPGGGWTPLVMNTNAAAVQRCPRSAGDEAPDRPQEGDHGRASGLRRRSATTSSRSHDPLYASIIPQRTYDPEKAKSLLKAAGQLDTSLCCDTSDAESDFVPLALVFAQGAKKAGVKVTIQTGSGGHILGQHLGRRTLHLQLMGIPGRSSPSGSSRSSHTTRTRHVGTTRRRSGPRVSSTRRLRRLTRRSGRRSPSRPSSCTGTTVATSSRTSSRPIDGGQQEGSGDRRRTCSRSSAGTASGTSGSANGRRSER